MDVSLAFLKRPQICIKYRLIGGRARSAKSDNREDAVDFRIARDHFFRLAADIARVRERRPLWGLHDEHQVALVVLWDEGPRNPLVEPVRAAKQRKKEQH